MADKPVFPLTVFYDGSCRVCSGEMAHYRKMKHGGRLLFIDISAPDFEAEGYGISHRQFMEQMHAIDQNGRIFRGVDAFRAIWQAFPDSPIFRLLSRLLALPGISGISRIAYRAFAAGRKYLPKKPRKCNIN